jgi:hypothetical protein
VVQLDSSGDATSNGASADSEGNAKGEKAETGKVDASKIDTDELARQVYGQLKRKLALEGERLGLSRLG